MTSRSDVGIRQHSKPVDLWFRFVCQLRWHSWIWSYSEDHSERYRCCRYCGRERLDAAFAPPIF